MKTYSVKSIHNGREKVWTGTTEYLVNDVFGYTLECGHSWSSRIPRYPKTIKSLVKALNDSANVCGRYNDFYEVAYL